MTNFLIKFEFYHFLSESIEYIWLFFKILKIILYIILWLVYRVWHMSNGYWLVQIQNGRRSISIYIVHIVDQLINQNMNFSIDFWNIFKKLKFLSFLYRIIIMMKYIWCKFPYSEIGFGKCGYQYVFTRSLKPICVWRIFAKDFWQIFDKSLPFQVRINWIIWR